MPDETVPTVSGFSYLSILRMLWKTKIWIIAVWLLVSSGAYVFIRRLPSIYKAEAVIMVDSQKIPEKFVSATVASDLQDRVASIRQQILSSQKLGGVIDEFGLYREERKTRVADEILEMMRSDITIKVEAAGAGGRPGSFRIGYQGQNPTVVAQVVNRLTNLYIEENLKTREVQAQGTTEFLDTQLQEAKRRLDELEGAVSAYKLAHNGELPQQENTLMGTLARLQVELEASRDAINRGEDTKVILENSLTSAEATLAAATRSTDPQAARLPMAPGAAPVPRKRSEVLQEQLDSLALRYSRQHPDIIRLSAELEATLRAEARQGSVAPPSSQRADSLQPGDALPVTSAQVAQMREQVDLLKERIRNTEHDLVARSKQQDRILEDIQSYQRRVEKLPVREQEMARITRDYQISKENYQSLLDKKIAAEMAADMERIQKSERLTVLDPARVPEVPVKPKRQLLFLMASVMGMALAVTLALGIELRRNVVLGEWELPKGPAVLGRLPRISVRTRSRAKPSKFTTLYIGPNTLGTQAAECGDPPGHSF